jgi:hypothetical protein
MIERLLALSVIIVSDSDVTVKEDGVLGTIGSLKGLFIPLLLLPYL